MIKLDKIEKVYRTKQIQTQALSNININIEKGEFVSIMGPSGCGKSTLLNIIGLLDAPTNGKISLCGSEILSYKDKAIAKIRNEKLGFIFQTFHLINDLPVVDNVEIPLLYRRVSSSVRRKLALEALDQVGLSSRAFHLPSQLSGGQQQRVATARAIAGKPEIILADEPTGNLDSQMGEEIIGLLLDLNKNFDTTIVMVTHDQNMADKTSTLR